MRKYIILTIVLVLLLLNIEIVLESSKSASILFFNKVFISIFPFIILSDILIYYDYHIFLKNSFIGKFISKIFNIDPSVTIIFILSILTSHPNNAIFIKNMLDNNEIDIKTANKMIIFTYFPSISFVIGTIGIYLYNDFKIGLILYLNCLFNNILIGLYLRKEKISKCISNNIKKDNFFNMIKNSINKGISSSYIILGNLIIFTIIINIIIKYIIINKTILFLITGIIELTNGLVKINTLDINLTLKLCLTSFILNFSGLSIIFQSASILSNYNINIKKILIIKLIFSLFTSFILLPSCIQCW